MTKLLILDKDGTLTTTVSGEKFVQYPKDQKLLPGVKETLQRYADEGWMVAIASNQGGVAAGFKLLGDAVMEMQYCLTLCPEHSIYAGLLCPDDGKTAIKVLSCMAYKPYPCYGSVQDSGADGLYRKPGPGMLNYLKTQLSENWKEALYVGDRPEDQQAASNAGIPFMWADEWRGEG
jgi:D-glycero-D-manno-heptose 1,7-bisphosphate phosphatase